MGFSRQGYWRGLPCPPPGDRPDSGIEPVSLTSPHWQEDSLPLAPPGKSMEYYSAIKKNEVMPFATTWMDLGIIILSAVSQTEKDVHDITHLWNLKKGYK